MASCKYNPGINSVNPYAVLNVTQQSQNVANNSSVIRYELLLYRPSAISSSASKSYSIVINGNTVKSGSTTIGGSGTKSIASGTVTIPHNADGTKNISFSFSLVFGLTWHGQSIGTGSASGSMMLNPIGRATTPTLSPSNLNLGSTITINLPRASTSFTHNLSWKFGNLSGTIGNGIATQASLTTSASWASQIPNGSSGTGFVICDTYNGNTFVGSRTVSFTASLSTGLEPIINRVSVYEMTSGISAKFNGFVQNKSTLNVVIDAYGQQGSSIKSYKTRIDGIDYSGQSFFTSAISKSGRIPIEVQVTDGRGLTATSTQYINVMSYHTPNVQEFSVERADAYGTIDPSGTYALIKIALDISPLNNLNDCNYKVEYKRTIDSYWNLIGNYSGYSFNGTKNGGNILMEEYTYDFRLTVTDYFGSVIVSPGGSIGTSFTLFNINEGGTSLCFGGISARTSTEKCFDFKQQVYDKNAAELAGLKKMNGYWGLNTPEGDSGFIRTTREGILPYQSGGFGKCGNIENPFSEGHFKTLYVNGKNIVNLDPGQKVLATINLHMTATHDIGLSEPISKQKNGIVLLFSYYSYSAGAKDEQMSSFFVPKKQVELFPSKGVTFNLSNHWYNAIKYLYISDTRIKGHDTNAGQPTIGNVKYNNDFYVLRYVIGV